MAVGGSAFNLSFVLAGLFLLRHFGRLSPLTAFLLTGAGSLLAACILLARVAFASDEISPAGRILWRPVLAENWHYGRWLVGSTILNSITNQTQTFLVAFFLGLSAAGILRAMQLPMLVMVQILAAAGPLILPSFSYDFGLGRMKQLQHKARLVNVMLGTAEVCFVAILVLFAGRVEHLLFAGKYAAHAWLMPVLALIPMCMGISMGYAMAMRARQKPRFDLIANAIAAPAAVFSAIALTYWWGLAGAATSMVAGSAVYMICVLKLYSSISHQPEKQSQSVKPGTQ
jgi:O-antigen/teichoic acid export membrane protein